MADAAAGIDISSSRMDQDSNDLASNGFGNCLTRDGQGQPTANLPMAGFKHTGVQNGLNRNDYAAMGQVQDGVGLTWTIAGGTSDAITATYTPAITALVDGQFCCFRGAASTLTTNPTFSPNGLTPRTIVRTGTAILRPNDIRANYEVILRYNLANTQWEILNPATTPGVVANAQPPAGTANALTITALSFASQDGYQVQFIATHSNIGAATIAVSGGAAQPIVRDTAAGPVALTGGEIIAGNSIGLVWDNSGTQWHVVNPILSIGSLQLLTSAMGMNMPINMGLTASVTSNLLTVALKTTAGTDPSASSPVWFPFQTLSSNNATGAPTWVELTSALSISTFATGATLGAPNTTPFRLWIVVFNNAGTPVLALINCSLATQIFPLVEALAQSTTGISGSATAAGTFYTPNGTSLTNCAFRILGYLDYDAGLTTSGTYNIAPSRVVQRTNGTRLPSDRVRDIYAITSTPSTITTSTPTTYLSQAITPSSAINLVRVDVSSSMQTANSGNHTQGQLYRNTTALGIVGDLSISAGGGSVNGMMAFSVLDAPGVTSSVPYNFKFLSSNNTNNATAIAATMIVAEIMG